MSRSLAVLLVAALVTARAPAQVAAPARVDLPVTTVALFSSGVGYFEHAGTVRGTSTAELRFRTAQINDILKSLVLQDVDGGRVSAVSYPSQEPVMRTLRSFQVDVTANPSLADLLNQLRGARVTVAVQSDRLSGTIIGVERRRVAVDKGGDAVEEPVLNILTTTFIRSVPLNGVTSLSLDDPQLQDELTRALGALSQSRDQDKKPVTIQFTGSGDRRVRVGYVVETPVWKTSYRLLLDDRGGRLQGWAIVENQTESDWTNVSLSLVSGRPISFIMDLYQPLYMQRPTVIPELFASLRPQVYDGGTDAAKDQVALGAAAGGGRGGGGGGGRGGAAGSATLSGVVRDATTGAPVPGVTIRLNPSGVQVRTGEDGVYRLTGLALGGIVSVVASRLGYSGAQVDNVRVDQTTTTRDLMINPNVMALDAITSSATSGPMAARVAGINPMSSVQTVAQGAKLGELFHYSVPNVTLARQKSAMLPIVGDSVGVERVSIYNASVLATNPLSGVRVRNTTGKHLLQGPVTVLDSGGYAGDARIDDVPPGQVRLVSFGIDLDMKIDNTKNTQVSTIITGRIVRGVLMTDRRNSATIEYRADNRSTREKTLIIEHPIRVGWKLTDTTQLIETTPGLYRFRGVAPAGKVAVFTVREDLTTTERVVLLSADVPATLVYSRTGELPAAVRDVLVRLGQMKQAIVEVERQMSSRTNQVGEITAEQERIRENMKTVASTTEYYRRLLTKLNEQETSLETLRKEINTLAARRDALQKELEDYLSTLNIG